MNKKILAACAAVGKHMNTRPIFITVPASGPGFDWVRQFVQEVKDYKTPPDDVPIRDRCLVHYIAPQDDRVCPALNGKTFKHDPALAVRPPWE